MAQLFRSLIEKRVVKNICENLRLKCEAKIFFLQRKMAWYFLV
ncbi:hypothetical protein EPIR_3183 [Erwinia piriflorinigrans CFBP 5888]|uniref:Uncharacterized protein n=1 Tax=Erwinia piriflorinigrans CFBP 5888 TaxID=1161919 RepID=V5ZC94_9GAMM|nr:hypothetical protein EPIR_3183 [Erwinia piriflorinigrans CFBP 5888]